MTRLLLLLSITLSVAGIVAGTVTGQWYLIPIILLAVGVVFFLTWIGITLQNRSQFWQKRTTEIGINSFISTIAVLTIIVLINFLVIRNPLRIDLTENQIFTLAPQSQAIAENLTQPLKVWIFDRNIDPETQTLLQNYQRYGENFSYQLVDPELEINIAEQFEVESLGEVYLEYGTKRQQIDSPVTPLGTNISEPQLTNAIAKIQQDRTPYMYFLQGHGEPALDTTEEGYSQAISELTERGYVVAPLNLAINPTIPENSDVIAIAKPLRRLLDSEITSLQQYLQNGGNLLLMLMPNTDIGLNSIWQNLGIQLDNRLVIDSNANGNRPPTILIVEQYGDHPITRNFGNGISLFPESRIIQTTEKDNITTTPLVITNENTWAESNLAGEEITFNPQEDLAGPLNIAIALTQESASRMVIFGNGIFATDGWFTQQLNGDLFLNTVDWLTGADQDILSIRPKELTNRRINLTPLQAEIISSLAIAILPLLSFMVAVTIWWRKR
ncbi:ABC-type uncharacterized transport system involved in gliding motility, auxiliary component [Hyella patelloides LEGE 07179]|uniref:ABC-type uncharacterized transport system involved in gliding motility, auxiliary component n=1 Tax=Hyella patelloides LEGE 07179 TaxID=945734 RepID=A0A563VQ97_9CYAN|nr:Gldg family protein [Hyella patelloides]VEP13603.1 ABC-type uncharacterized transport system involved in gliding motility, auxiliary component [Hyella patelloides LEGE 07179]